MSDELICEICHKKGFKDARGLQGHIRIVHGLKAKKIDGYDGEMVEIRKDIINHILSLRDRFVVLEDNKAEILSRFPKVGILQSWFESDDKEAGRQMRNEMIEAIKIEQKEIREHISKLCKQIGLKSTKESTKEVDDD